MKRLDIDQIKYTWGIRRRSIKLRGYIKGTRLHRRLGFKILYWHDPVMDNVPIYIYSKMINIERERRSISDEKYSSSLGIRKKIKRIVRSKIKKANKELEKKQKNQGNQLK